MYQDDICSACSKPVDVERAAIFRELFPERALICVNCSRIEAPLVLMDYSHKTAGTVFVVPTNSDGTRNHEADRKALRVYRRSR